MFEGDFEGRQVAVKRILKKYFDLHLKEISLLRSGADSHENVIKFYSTESDSTYHYIALELCDATLEKYVVDNKEFEFLRQRISEKQVLLETSRGLSHLHKLGIS